MNSSSTDIAHFYDRWVPAQVKVGINLRHRTIFRLLKREGMQRDHTVLEVGCGVGAVTGLVARYLRRGQLTAVDISPTSVAQARARLSGYNNIEFLVSDMSGFAAKDKYDVIFLPDVLEHIPVGQHPALFRTLHAAIRSDGFVLIHIPNPHYLDWVRRAQPEKLQIVDQSLHTYPLLKDVYESGFYLQRLSSHSIFQDTTDYQVLVLRVDHPLRVVKPRGRNEVRLQSLMARFFY